MIKRLEDLSEEEIQQIIASGKNKRMVIAVHPYHNHTWRTIGDHSENRAFTEYIRGPVSEKVLTLIMDTKRGMEIFARETKQQSNGTILWVETIGSSNPRPTIGWKGFIRRLTELQAQRIWVGGRALHPFSIERWKQRNGELRQLIKENYWNEARKTFGEEKSYLVAIARAAKIKKQARMMAGCAGVTAAKLTTTQKFKVKTTRHFT